MNEDLFADADARYRSAPWSLSNRDIEVLEQGGNGSARSVREQARREQQQRTPAVAGADESVEALAKQYPATRVTFPMLGKMFDQCMNAVMKMFVAENRHHERELSALQTRVSELEANKSNRVTGVTWAGPYESGKRYHSGELCQKNGLWLCTASETTAAPGTAPSDWKLVVHRKLVPKNDDEE